MANQDLSFSVSPEVVNAGKAAYGENYGNVPPESANTNRTLTGGKISPESSVYRYPLKKIEASDDYLEIRIRQYVPPKFNIDSGSVDLRSSTEVAKNLQIATKYRIQLPIPGGIQDSNQVDWGSDSINSLEAFGVNKVSEALTSSSLPETLVNILKSTGQTIENLSVSGGQDLITQFFAGKLVNSLGGNVNPQSLLTRSTGLVLNPNMELLFNSVNLRSFTFTFDFAPREAAEAAMVKKIIRTFKRSMSPKTTVNAAGDNPLGKGLFISSPDIFELEYKSGANPHPFLHKFKPCALVNMGVDYTASGPYATYDDATPVHMKLSLQFTELNPIYEEDYDLVPEEQGVGY